MLTHQFALAQAPQVDVHLIGAGGTGSHVLSGLVDIAMTLPHVKRQSINVTVWDSDTVSTANLGRQRFYPADVGANKAEVLVHRINAFFGLNFVAKPCRLTATSYLEKSYGRKKIVIGCVDSAAARRTIGEWVKNNTFAYWLDCGNTSSTAQAVLGQPLYHHGHNDVYGRLPTVLELFPTLRDASVPDDDQPSCSVAEAIQKQDLTVNRASAQAALEILWTLLRQGSISYSAKFVNTRSGQVSTLRVDPKAWRRFGHVGKRKPPTRKTTESLKKKAA
ncbi:MAG: PRTRC system ThiF family protein [Rhodocyclaceae bacterium]|nr:PRTRC system ThiF family protein [Rhodocyclaceae bacterium]MCA3025360.1 PRTRC system ThiF family protein [Rhodocyclaceae bacterium]MCA3028817.1 PRTRC system ThiF family protein [Rhodocyclaceae bacterium]MCA3032936.1 PRTRC system ThiF family protein [Rhodocyclaceae bacterium]MCA3037377.1 PRTRC system ThiF family protein [Rhodocyclaceae bacterium]